MISLHNSRVNSLYYFRTGHSVLRLVWLFERDKIVESVQLANGRHRRNNSIRVVQTDNAGPRLGHPELEQRSLLSSLWLSLISLKLLLEGDLVIQLGLFHSLTDVMPHNQISNLALHVNNPIRLKLWEDKALIMYYLTIKPTL